MNGLLAYILSKGYTDKSILGITGVLAGKNCTIESYTHENGVNTIVFKWTADDGTTRRTTVEVYDGTPIYVYTPGDTYHYGDLVIYASAFYRCIVDEVVATTEIDDTKWNELGSPDGNYDIVQNSSLLPVRFTPADRKMYYSIEDATFYLWDGTEWVPQAMGALGEDLDVTRTVGGISTGDHYDSGSSIEQILRDMLNPTDNPTFTAPSAVLTATGNKLLEKGSTLNTTFTLTFNRGKINPAYGTSGYRSGVASSYTFDGETKTTNTFTKTITESKLEYQGSVAYEAGEQPKNSKGEDYSSPLPAGSVNSNKVEYEFVDAWWENAANPDNIVKHTLVSKKTGSLTISFAAVTRLQAETFDVPATWTVSGIKVYNTLSKNWDDCSAEFTKTTTTHPNAAGTDTAYNRYTCNLGYGMGAREIKVEWSTT